MVKEPLFSYFRELRNTILKQGPPKPFKSYLRGLFQHIGLSKVPAPYTGAKGFSSVTSSAGADGRLNCQMVLPRSSTLNCLVIWESRRAGTYRTHERSDDRDLLIDFQTGLLNVGHDETARELV